MVMASFLSGSFLIGIAYENLSDLFAFAGLGILAIVAAITYTVGVKPYGYMGLGDISVLVFFGLLVLAVLIIYKLTVLLATLFCLLLVLAYWQVRY